MRTAGRQASVTLRDRYELEDGRVFLSGIQALVRVLLDQRRADARAGLNTAAFVSGYQGSPLAGFDREVQRLRGLAAEHRIVHQPGLNEELAATSVWGSQLAPSLPGGRYDGVLGVWYGKAPGVDRAADALRHGNFVGASPKGGLLALAGDDPSCKSSTVPGASEGLLSSLQFPILYPGSIQEVLDLGRHAIACSRASGLWTALKVVTNVADATATVAVGLDRVAPVLPTLEWDGAPYVHRPNGHLLAPVSLEMERTMHEVRLELARRYARLNDLNPITHDPPGARVGVIAAGVTYHDLLHALEALGLGDDPPVRILKIGMLYPLEDETVRAFAEGLDEIVVVEEKGPFLERLVKEALYGTSRPPMVVGRHDERGAPLTPVAGALDADAIARVIGSRLLRRDDLPSVVARLDQIEAVAARAIAPIQQRTAFFCSGCPHNTSTPAPDGTLVGAGIGCHTMVVLNPEGRGQLTGLTQMGGEGAQWIGMAPFVEPRHFTQNLGDGTFHHSGSLAIRAAVAAGVNVTYKIFYNGAVAMTGGQDVEGQLSVPDLTRMLQLEGVRRIVVTTEDTGRYAGVELAAIAEVRPRRDILDVQRELAEVPGVTVLVHDQACAAELRRARKRGTAIEPRQRVVINERVCEGCGDCGAKSGCLSVEPVETEFGRKTRIHQASCNKDLSCLEGDCPSFLTVVAPKAEARPTDPTARLAEVQLPDPEPCVDVDDVQIRLVGIGGTGVVTVSQVLGMAALLDGRHVLGLDQTGLSQKAGPVSSDLRISAGHVDASAPIAAAGADVLLGFDLLGAASERHLRVSDPHRTVAVVSTSVVPTGRMVVDVGAAAPDATAAEASITAQTRADASLFVPAQELSEAVFADHMPANVVVVGAAWQRGALPLSREAVHEAFRLNGAAVEQNIAAFEWGRACVAAPELVEQVLRGEPHGAARAEPSARDRELVERAADGADELRRLLEVRVPDLVAYQSRRYAERYADAVAHARSVEAERVDGSTAIAEAVARNLHKLMAYKDEYEVARLHLEGLAALAPGTKVSFHLHPPLLRALGLERKLRLGRWFVPAFRLLRRGRRLRGTALDPFGHAHVRRVERALVGEYLDHVEAALAHLSPATRDLALELCELPDVIRGYEEIKLAGVERFRARAAELRERLEGRTALPISLSAPPAV